MSSLSILFIGVTVSLICLSGLVFTILELRQLGERVDRPAR